MTNEELEHKQELLQALKQRLHQLELKEAKFGVTADPIIPNEIAELQRRIRTIENEIQLYPDDKDLSPSIDKKRIIKNDAPSNFQPIQPNNKSANSKNKFNTIYNNIAVHCISFDLYLFLISILFIPTREKFSITTKKRSIVVYLW